MSKRAAIPDSPDPTAQALTQNVRRMTGQLRNEPPLQPLPSTATLAELIAAYNALLQRMQGE